MTLQTTAARIYMTLAEQQPADAPDEWFLQSEDTGVTHERVGRFLDALNDLRVILRTMDSATPEDFQTEFYNAAKAAFADEKGGIRMFFRYLYALIFWTDSGPRWGDFVYIVGVPEFERMLDERGQL